MLSIIIPCYNEEKDIKKILKKFLPTLIIDLSLNLLW